MRPFDPETEEILLTMLGTRKMRMNHELSRQMMTEIKPWDLDIEELGSSRHANMEEEEDDDEIEFKKDSRMEEFEALLKEQRKSDGPEIVRPI